MVCDDCRQGQHAGCVDITEAVSYQVWLDEFTAAGTLPDASLAAGVPRGRHCACQHVGSAVADNPAHRLPEFETTYPDRPATRKGVDEPAHSAVQ